MTHEQNTNSLLDQLFWLTTVTHQENIANPRITRNLVSKGLVNQVGSYFFITELGVRLLNNIDYLDKLNK